MTCFWYFRLSSHLQAHTLTHKRTLRHQRTLRHSYTLSSDIIFVVHGLGRFCLAFTSDLTLQPLVSMCLKRFVWLLSFFVSFLELVAFQPFPNQFHSCTPTPPTISSNSTSHGISSSSDFVVLLVVSLHFPVRWLIIVCFGDYRFFALRRFCLGLLCGGVGGNRSDVFFLWRRL